MKRRISLMIALGVLGILVSLYLLTVHWGWWSAICLGVGDCEAVNTSIYSEFFGIPVALIGSLTYLAIIALGVLSNRKIGYKVGPSPLFFLAVIGVVFSGYLTVIEVFVLHAICPWCVMSAIMITLIAVLAGRELIES